MVGVRGARIPVSSVLAFVPKAEDLNGLGALIKANKDFDLLMLPNQQHGYVTMNNYMMRRRWDYFVRWLLGVEPPKEFEFQATPPGGGRVPAPPTR